MKINGLIIAAVLMLNSCLLNSCKKYLDLKPDKKLAVPSSVKDLQALLDYNYMINKKAPTYDEASADNHYMTQAQYQSEGVNRQRAYIWENYDYEYPNDWGNLYDVVNIANEVLNDIEGVERTELNGSDWDNVKGSALFFRSASFLKCLWIFSKAFDDQTAATDPGIVLRTTSGYNQKSARVSVKESYNKVLEDLATATSLLPGKPVHVMRPSKPAVYGLLARVYLSMRKYDSAYKYSNLCLQIKNDLMDYNGEQVDDLIFPFKQFNQEVIYSENTGVVYYSISPGTVLVDSTLYQSYDNNDLRKRAFFLDASLFFPGVTGFIFKGTYTGNFGDLFTGITTAEMFLTRSECYARLGKKEEALSDLNNVLKNRFLQDAFTPVSVATSEEALSVILEQRRKELVFRGLRWMDIKRLNKEGAGIVLQRTVDGKEYKLMPNENRYALPLPSDIIRMTGMQQNPK